MKGYLPFLLHQILRFGALTASQMQGICSDLCSRATLYRDLKILVEQGYVIRMMHPKRFELAFSLTPDAYPLVFSPEYVRPRDPRPQDLRHTLKRAEVMLELARYSYVHGLTTEYELTPAEVKKFSGGRTPDGIIQIARPGVRYELAIEYETFQKTDIRIEEILNQYDLALRGRGQCAGLIVVTDSETTFNGYQKILESMPEDFRQKVILRTMSRLDDLNEKYFGAYHPRGSGHVRLTLDRVRTISQGLVEYSSLKSIPSLNKLYLKDPHIKGQSLIEV